MIFEDLIKTALTPEKPNGVQVRTHVRKKPSNPKREEVHSALRRLRDCVPTEGRSNPAGHRVAS